MGVEVLTWQWNVLHENGRPTWEWKFLHESGNSYIGVGGLKWKIYPKYNLHIN